MSLSELRQKRRRTYGRVCDAWGEIDVSPTPRDLKDNDSPLARQTDSLTVSVINVTYRRPEVAAKVFLHNRENSGEKWDELIWVDQGKLDSNESVAKQFDPDILLLQKENPGVSVGFNRAFALCRSDWIMILGHRCYLPRNWLLMLKTVAATGQVDAISILDKCDPLMPGLLLPPYKDEHIGMMVRRSLIYGSTLFRRSLLFTVGYWREDLGMYCWNDVEWARRHRARGTRSYSLSRYYKTRDADQSMTVDGVEYRQWRTNECSHPDKRKVLDWCNENNWPFYRPC